MYLHMNLPSLPKLSYLPLVKRGELFQRTLSKKRARIIQPFPKYRNMFKVMKLSQLTAPRSRVLLEPDNTKGRA
jgi:hypothetical protein